MSFEYQPLPDIREPIPAGVDRLHPRECELRLKIVELTEDHLKNILELVKKEGPKRQQDFLGALKQCSKTSKSDEKPDCFTLPRERFGCERFWVLLGHGSYFEASSRLHA
jgi:hypothetical protein